jgi:hypothetical protein
LRMCFSFTREMFATVSILRQPHEHK